MKRIKNGGKMTSVYRKYGERGENIWFISDLPPDPQDCTIEIKRFCKDLEYYKDFYEKIEDRMNNG